MQDHVSSHEPPKPQTQSLAGLQYWHSPTTDQIAFQIMTNDQGPNALSDSSMMAQVCVILPKKAARYETELDDRLLSSRQTLMRNFPQSVQLDVLLLPLCCTGHRHHGCATQVLGHHKWLPEVDLLRTHLKAQSVCFFLEEIATISGCSYNGNPLLNLSANYSGLSTHTCMSCPTSSSLVYRR